MKKALVVIGLTLVFSAGFIALRDNASRGRGPARAPAFEVSGLDGRKLGPQSFQGSVVLVNFWATYCLPCIDEMPSLERLWKDHGSQGLVVLAVATDDSIDEVRKFQRKFGLTFSVAHDPGWSVAHAWGTQKLPETYVIARSGEIRTRVMGAVDWGSPTYRSLVEGLLREART